MSERTNFLLQLYSPTAPVFLADIDPSCGVLRLHVCQGVDAHAVRERALAALATQERLLGVTVEQHKRKNLTQPRSIEHWLCQLAPRDVVYDPMMVVMRARHLVCLAQSIHRVPGKRGKGIFFDAAQNVLVVVVRPMGDRAETSTLVQRAVDEAFLASAESAGGAQSAGMGIRVVSERPGVDLVPVDRLSASVLGLLRSIARQTFAPAALAIAGMAFIGSAAASTSPRQAPEAVDAAQFGVLAGLSMLSDTTSRSRLDTFSSAALEMYFGRSAAAEKAMKLAQGGIQNNNIQPMDSPGS